MSLQTVTLIHGDNPKSANVLELQEADFCKRDAAIETVSEMWDNLPRIGSVGSPLVSKAKRLMRERRFEDALSTLAHGRCVDAESLNLTGVLYELMGEPARARVFYRRALNAEPAFWAAKMNLVRLYELHAFGTSDVPQMV